MDMVNWIENILELSTLKTQTELKKYNNTLEFELAKLLVDKCHEFHIENPTIDFGKLLASAFDLIVCADYYSVVSHKGWFYCNHNPPKLFYNYTNCCARHALNNQLFFNPSGKPSSGSIGKTTSRSLRTFFNLLIKKYGRSEEVLKGVEPVDIVIVNREKHKILFAEIKSAPLLTLPIAVDAEKITAEADGKLIEVEHSPTDNSNFFQSDCYIFIPMKDENGIWRDNYFPLGRRKDISDKYWGFRGIIDLLKNEPTFLKTYFLCWNEALLAYYPKQQSSVYWLTNGSGAPTPRPNHWPKSKNGEGDGYETVSDSKTSVGMDRTDDIKKSIYQVLKLGSQGKPLQLLWDFKVGIISNIHAARHYKEYLESLQDIIWTLDASGKAKKARDLASDQDLYNLFDGIISLTQSFYRDDWLQEVFYFLNEEPNI